MARLVFVALASIVVAACNAPVAEESAATDTTGASTRTRCLPIDPELLATVNGRSPESLCLGTGEAMFTDETARSGLVHVHRVGGVDRMYDRGTGGGGALDDFDGDGDLDLALTSEVGANELFLQAQDGTFARCSLGEGQDERTYGLSAADVEGDGDADLLVLNVGANRLLLNRGDGTFVDATAQSGLVSEERSATASWADLDHDGDLDLMLAALVQDASPQYSLFEKGASSLHENLGDARFGDRSSELPAGGLPTGSSFVAPLLDLDGDGLLDLLLTQEFGNVSTKTHLYRNLGTTAARTMGDRWLDWRLMSDVQHSVVMPTAVMGVAVLDLNADGLPDLFMTNLFGDPPDREVLHMNNGDFTFADETLARGLATMSASGEIDNRTVSWGTTAQDFNNDGLLDVYTVYGNLVTGADFQVSPEFFAPLRSEQPNALLLQQADGTFVEARGSCSEDRGRGRAVIPADIDEDGCVDLVIINQDEPLRYLHNRCAYPGRGINLKLSQTGQNPEGIGAVLALATSAGEQTRWVEKGTLTSSSKPARVHFGVPSGAVVESLRVRWPDGYEQTFTDLLDTTGLQRLERD